MIVIGDKTVAAYRNQIEANDFRTYAGADPADDFDSIGESLSTVAIQACQALRVEFGGVDILEHSSGRLYLLEANFPCYFATAQEVAGLDISGALVDSLHKKSARLAANKK